MKKIRMAELSDDCRLLVISHMPLAYAMAWRLKDYGVSLEDLRQEGCLGLCEAAMRYNENVDSSFATYARHWCRKMMLLAIRCHRRSGNGQEAAVEGQTDEDLLRTAQRQRIDEALQCLTPQEQQAVRLYYGLDGERSSLTEIATSLGISKARVSSVHQHALGKLESALLDRPLVNYLAPWLE